MLPVSMMRIERDSECGDWCAVAGSRDVHRRPQPPDQLCKPARAVLTKVPADTMAHELVPSPF